MSDQDIRVEIKGNAEDLRLAARSAVGSIRDVAQETRRANAEMVVSNAAAGRSLKNLEDRQAGLAQASRNFGASWRAIGWSALLGGIGPVTAAVADLGVAATGAGAALAPLAGVAATLPNLLGAAGQAGLVAKLAFDGMGQALAGNQKALAKLTPEAQRFVTTIRGEVGPAVKDLQKLAQAGLLPGVTDGVHSLMRDLPAVKQIVTDTSKQLGALAREAGRQFSTPAFQKDLKAFGEENVKVIGRLGDAGLHAADGVRNLTMAAQPLVDDLSKTVDHLSAQADAWITKQRANGGLADFFDLTDQRVHQSLSILGNLGSTLLNVAGAAQPLAGGLMSGLVNETKNLAQITGSTQGRRALADFFQGAEAPLHQVALLARDLAGDLGKLAVSGQSPLAQLAHDARVDVLPALSDLAQIFTVRLLPHVITLAGSLGHLAHDIEPGIKAAMPAVTGLLDAFTGIVGDVDDLTRGLPGVAKLIPALAVTGAVLLSWKKLQEAWTLAPGSVKGAVAVARGTAATSTAAATSPALGIPVIVPSAAAGSARAGAAAALTARERALMARGGVILDPAAIAARQATTATGASGGLAAGASSLAASPAARAIGQSLAIGAAAAFGPELAKRLRDGLSTGSQDFGLPKHQAIKIDTGLPNLNPLHALGLPDFGPQGIAKLGLDAINKVINLFSGGSDKLKSFGDTAEQAFKKLQAAGDSRGMTALADQARTLAREFPKAGAQLDAFAGAVDAAARQRVIPDFEKMRAASGKSLSEIRSTVDSTMFDIQQRLGFDSAQGRDAMAHNFQDAVFAISQSMKAGAIATKTGLAEIRSLMKRELALYGIGGKQASNYLSGLDTVSGKPLATSPGSPSPGHAGGAMIVGRPGEKGRDDVPALLNGHPAVVARGEMVAVLNRHQQAAMDQAARAGGYGGLAGLMAGNSRPHYLAGGGLVGGAGFFPAPGTDYGYGQEPQIASRLDRLAHALGLHLIGISGHRTPQHSVEVGGFANDPHTRGQASDTPGVEAVAEAVLERFGLTRPLPGAAEADHIQLLGGKGGGGGGLAAAIRRVRFPGGLGAISALGQAGLDRVRDAANQALSNAATASGATAAAASLPTGSFPGPTGETLMRRIAQQRGWNFNDWWGVDAIETGHGVNLVNPTSSARLRGQFLSMNWGKYGPGSDPRQNPSMTEQIYAMAEYIAARYGNPTAALAHEHAYSSYARGALLHAASGIVPSILSTANPVTPDPSAKAKKAKKAKKTVKVVGLPGVPRPVKPRKGTSGTVKTPHFSQIFNRLLAVPEVKAPSVQGFEDQIGDLDAAIGLIEGTRDYGNDSQTITLPVSQALAAGLITAADAAQAGLAASDQVEVVNRDGGIDASDRRFHRGILAHVSDLDRVIGLRGDILGQLGAGGQPGELGSLGVARVDYIREAVELARQLADMQRFYDANVSLRSDLSDQRRAMEHRRPKDWRELVQADHATIKRYETYLSDLGGLPSGFKYDKSAVHDRRTQVQGQIKHLEAEVRQLESSKPNVGAHNIARYQRLGRHIALIDSEDQILQGQVTGAFSPTRGKANDIFQVITGLNDNVTQVNGMIRTLTDQTIPQRQQDVANDQADRADWLGTTAPALAKGSGAGDSGLAALLGQQLADTQRQHNVDVGELAALKDFAPLVNLRYLGAFARGITDVSQTGLAILHKGETVTPDPQGPFGSQIAQGGDGVTVELHFADNSGQLVRLVDARIDGRSARVVSEKLGTRQRLLTVAPG